VDEEVDGEFGLGELGWIELGFLMELEIFC
jgi:hypothetical protein